MSFNSYQQISPEMQNYIEQAVNSKLIEKSQTTTWFNPVTARYYIANDPKSTKPDYGIAITKEGRLKGIDRSRLNKPMGQTLTGAGLQSSTELDKARYNIFTDEVVNDAVMFYDRMDQLRKEYHNTGDEARFLGAGTITAQDYAAVGNVMIDQTVLDLITRDFIILDAVTRKTWDRLVYTFDNRTPYLNTGGLGELDVAPPRSISYSRGTINLKKAEGHVSVSIWAGLAIRDHDMVGDNTSIIDADFERIFATEVASTLTGFTDQATAGAYDVIAGGAFHSTTNPALRFDADSASIRTAGGRADTILINTRGYRALTQNTYLRLSGSPVGAVGTPTPATSTFSTTHSLLPGYNIYVDELATDDNMYIYDKRAVVFLEGPSSVRNVELNYGTIRDTVSDRWYGSGIKVSGWGVEETNIHS
jgi:hypothetical protein